MGFTGPSGSSLPLLAERESSLAPSPSPAPPEGGATRRDGGTCPGVVVGTIGFPTALLTFPGTLSHAGSSSRTAARAARTCVSTCLRDPPDLRCRLSRHLPSPSAQPVTRLDFLLWVHPKIAPPSSWRHRSPLPEKTPRGTASFESRLPRRLRVPSSWFLTTSTASSSDAVRVSCNALPTLGFIPFQTACRRSPSNRFVLPRDASLPSEAFPPSAAAPPPDLQPHAET